MSKELTPLETLNELTRVIKGVDTSLYQYNEYISDIKKALKELEEYEEQDIKVCAGSFLTCKSDFETLWKERKALEIIKEKNVDIQIFNDSKYCSSYNSTIVWNSHCEKRKLTQEEYELLKEVLG